jgi:hypothetical protein
MAARIPKLSEKALLRIAEASQAEGLTPDAVVLKFVPATPKKSDYLKRVEAGVKVLRKDPKARAEAEECFFSRKAPKGLSVKETDRLADEAVRQYRASKKAKAAQVRDRL